MIYIGIDVGKTGGVTILEDEKCPLVYDCPILKIPNSNKKAKIKWKNTYDIDNMVKIFLPYKRRQVSVAIENIHPKPGEGTVSSFDFGRGLGLWQGIVSAFQFECTMVNPQMWKKSFPELITDEMLKIREEGKKANGKVKTILNRKFKELAKTEARFLAQKLYSDIAGMFVRKKDDGRAESLLIAVHLKMEKK